MPSYIARLTLKESNPAGDKRSIWNLIKNPHFTVKLQATSNMQKHSDTMECP